MRSLKFWTPLLCLLIVLVSSGLVQAEKHYKYAPAPDKAVYFGHVSYTEIENDAFDPLVFSAYNLPPKKAILNFPLGPGDSVLTSAERRCEIQFDTGTILRLDFDTEVQLETVLAPSLTSRKLISNIVLKRGQAYVMYKRYNRSEVFQVLTPNASVKLEHSSVSSIKVEDGLSQVWVDQGKVSLLYGIDSKHSQTYKLKKSHSAAIDSDHQLLNQTGGFNREFSLWNKDMNKNFLALHKGKTPLPKPIQKLPKAVFYFAQKYSNIYGEWLWDSFYGYVWRPFYNDYYPWGNWSPYYYGQWHMSNDQLFWIPQESWGWVPYHLGLWIWNKNKGWFWLPGSAFAPAWATWKFFFGSNMLAWRPLGPWDWAVGSNTSYRYYSDLAYPILPKDRCGGDLELKNDPKNGKDSSDTKNPRLYPPYKMPKELKSLLKKVKDGIARNDPKVIQDISGSVRGYAMVNARYLHSSRIHEKLIDPGVAEATIKSGIYRESPNPAQAAANLYWIHGARYSSELKKSEVKNESAVSASPSISHRFRDWNPDAKVASRQGVTLRYVGRQNAISAPEMSYNRTRQSGNSFTRGYFSSSRSGSSSNSSSGSSLGSTSSGSSSRATGTVSSSSGGSRGSGGKGKK